MPMPSSQHNRPQAGKASNNAGWFFDQYVAEQGFDELDLSANGCATELLDSMEADRSLGSLGANKDLDMEALPLMDWESPSMGMEGWRDSLWSTSQNHTLTSASCMSFGGSGNESSNFDGSFQHGHCSDVITNEVLSNEFGPGPSTLPESNTTSLIETPIQHESQQISDTDSFAVLNSVFRDLVQAKAAADSRCLSQKTKQRDASIALHLQRLRAACDQTAQLLENPAVEPETADSIFGSQMISACGDETEAFESPMWNCNLENTTATCSSSGGYCSTQNSPPESSCSGPSQRGLPELSSCSDSFSPSKTQPPSTTQTPSGPQGKHENGAMEIVLDMNMNPSKCLPRKQRKRSQAQKERYQNVRKHGACLKHKKLKKLCTCFDNVAPQAGACQKIEANSSKLPKARNDTGSVRACQPIKSPQINNRESSFPLPSGLPMPSTSPGHDRLLSEKRVQNSLEAVGCGSSPEATSFPLLCLIPGCTYSDVDVSALESHYGSAHAHELSHAPVTLSSQSPVSQPWARPVASTPTTQARSGLHTVQSLSSRRQELAPGTVHTEPTELLSQQQQTLHVQGTGRIDPDIDCRIVGSCDVLDNAINSLRVRGKSGRTDVSTDLLQQVFGLFSLPTIWFVGIFWSFFVKLFAWVLAKRPSVRYNWHHASISRGIFKNIIGGILT